MKKTNIIVMAAAMALFAMERPAQASLTIIPSTEVTLTTPGHPSLNITYEVTKEGSLYTYTYDLASTVNLSSFTIGGSTDPILTGSLVITGTGVDAVASGVTADSVYWDWSDASTTEDVSFTSCYAPGSFNLSVNDDGTSWGAPPNVPAPAPVPEASTVMAGVLMLLPFGVGAIRSLRKERAV